MNVMTVRLDMQALDVVNAALHVAHTYATTAKYLAITNYKNF